MILVRYILKMHLAPFFGSFFVLMSLFVLQSLMKLMDQLLGKGLSGTVIFELIFLNLAWIVVLTLPMAVLVSTLMAFGKLASQNELTAMKAGGMSLSKMMLPVLISSLAVTWFAIEFNNKILPEANHQLKTLTIDIHRKKPTLSLTPGLISQDLQGYSILVQETFSENNSFKNVSIVDHRNPNSYSLITAKNGSIKFSPDYKKIILDLHEGEIHELTLPEYSSYRIVKFNHQLITTDAEGFEFIRSDENTFSRGDRELSASAMQYIVDSLNVQASTIKDRINRISNYWNEKLKTGSAKIDTKDKIVWEQIISFTDARSQLQMLNTLIENENYFLNSIELQILSYEVEIQKKYSIPFACFVFVLIGAPLGVMIRRGGFGVAATISLIFFVIYWASLIGGEKLADREFMSPWLGMWIANIVIGLFGLILYYRVAKENVEIKFNWWKKFIPKRFNIYFEK